MSKIFSKPVTFAELKRNFDDCIYAIPKLQRNYIWDKKRVCMLFDSIYNHYPIGVSLIWKAKSNQIAELKHSTKTIMPSFNPNRSTIDFIIDGQQRLTSIYGVIDGINQSKDFNSKIDFKKICFSFDKNSDRFSFVPKYDISNTMYMPVHDIINCSPARLKRRFDLNKQKMSEVLKLKENIRTYKFHFIFIETNSVNEVKETFVRINSQGMKVSNADRIFARITDVNLRELVESTRHALMRVQFNEIEPKSFIYTLALSKGEKEIGQRALDNFTKKFERQESFKSQFKKEWKKYHRAFSSCVDFLVNDFGISNYSLLPSDNIFTMLSLFFYKNKGNPTTAQKKEIKKWFWHTALGERYSGSAFSRNITKDIDFFTKLVSKANYKYAIDEKINPNELLKKDYSKTNQSAVAGFYLFLRKQKPKYLEMGYPMMLDNTLAISNRKDKHHIFPKALLARRRIKSKWNNSLLNICFLAANENQLISDDKPRNYMGDYRRKRHFKKVMRSHLIPAKPDSGVWETNLRVGFKKFLNQRAPVILNSISKIADVKKNKLFESFEEIKRV
jgi:hypothetical protein